MNKHALVTIGSRLLELHYNDVNLAGDRVVREGIVLSVDLGDWPKLKEYVQLGDKELWYLFDPEYYRPADQRDPHVIGMRILNYVACNGRYLDPRSYFNVSKVQHRFTKVAG